MTVLYIDDDIDDRAIFSEALEHIDPSCFFLGAATGEAALKILLMTVPDYIFLDVNMPQLNGKDVLRSIRLSEDLKNVPVIMFSTSISERDRKEFLAAGANDCVTKPSGFDQLCEVIQSVLFPNDLRRSLRIFSFTDPFVFFSIRPNFFSSFGSSAPGNSRRQAFSKKT